jgi:hypothetical protein
MVAGFIDPLKTAVTTAFGQVPCDPLRGTTEITVGTGTPAGVQQPKTKRAEKAHKKAKIVRLRISMRFMRLSLAAVSPCRVTFARVR